MKDTIKQFIIDELEKKQRIPSNINIDDYRFLDEGHIDSLGAMKFIIAIEDQFSIELSPDEIVSKEFRYVGSLAQLIESKLKS
tara:strand:- start:8208 stop:8456 length:249 start_codon:yes stop_codon:yes gene_type:complete